jgi:hypothetical protein
MPLLQALKKSISQFLSWCYIGETDRYTHDQIIGIFFIYDSKIGNFLAIFQFKLTTSNELAA